MCTIKKKPLTAMALAFVLLGSPALTSNTAEATEPVKNHDTRRAFYLTKGTFPGGQALNACASGFHMASIWEINATTLLRYDSSLGRTHGDSAVGGPPALGAGSDPTAVGWIRTGTSDSNCQRWTSSSPADLGSVGLPILDDKGPRWALGSDATGGGFACDGTSGGARLNPGVWCVQD